MESHTLYDGKIVLNFDAAKHIYTVGTKIVYGVTSIKDVINKPQLMYWAVKMAVQSVENDLKPGVAYDEFQIKQILENASKAHRTASNKAADIGTLAHSWISDYVYAVATKGHIPDLPVNKEALNAVKAFVDWAKSVNIQITSSERKLYSIVYGFAGTLDAEALIDGKRWVVDFKTSSGIYPEYELQLAAYIKAREEESGEKYGGGIIVRIDKATGAFETKSYSSEYMEQQFDVFLACLKIYEWQQKIKDNEKQLKLSI